MVRITGDALETGGAAPARPRKVAPGQIALSNARSRAAFGESPARKWRSHADHSTSSSEIGAVLRQVPDAAGVAPRAPSMLARQPRPPGRMPTRSRPVFESRVHSETSQSSEHCERVAVSRLRPRMRQSMRRAATSRLVMDCSGVRKERQFMLHSPPLRARAGYAPATRLSSLTMPLPQVSDALLVAGAPNRCDEPGVHVMCFVATLKSIKSLEILTRN